MAWYGVTMLSTMLAVSGSWWWWSSPTSPEGALPWSVRMCSIVPWDHARWWTRRGDPERARRGTLVDAMDEESVVALVRVHSRGATCTDDLMQRLVRTFDTFPPSEGVMQRLSYMHQQQEGKGGVQEFSLATAHAAAMVSLMVDRKGV